MASVVVMNPAASAGPTAHGMNGTSSGARPAGSIAAAPQGAQAQQAKPKSALVIAAERLDRRTATFSGYLRKKNSANRWQKRYFEIVSNYWVYYKSSSS